MINIPEGTRISVTSTFNIDGIEVALRSTGEGATLDGASAARLVHVSAGGHLTLENVHLENGKVSSSSGGCAFVEGTGSTLVLRSGVQVRGCASDGDPLSTFASPVFPGGPQEAGGGGGIAAFRRAPPSVALHRTHVAYCVPAHFDLPRPSLSPNGLSSPLRDQTVYHLLAR